MRMRPRHALAMVVLLLAGSGCGDDGKDPEKADPTPSLSVTPSPTRTTPQDLQQYVALGDSYTAAPGVPPDQPGPCLRSEGNYPSLLAEELGAELDDRSCSAATLDHLTTAQHDTVPPQLDGLSEETDLVTLSLGANPALSRLWFFGCPSLRDRDPEGSPCRDAVLASEGDGLEDGFVALGRRLDQALQAIGQAAPDARVVVVGYPSIFPAAGSCPDRLTLATGDIRYADQLLRRLNGVLEASAGRSGAAFANAYAATRGHDICAEDAWIQGRTTVPGVALFYHPRAAEQQAVAEVLAELLEG